MKITIEVEDKGNHLYAGTLQAGKEKVISNWSINPDHLPRHIDKGINLEMLAMYNLGKGLLADYCRPRMYERQRGTRASKKVTVEVDQTGTIIEDKKEV